MPWKQDGRAYAHTPDGYRVFTWLTDAERDAALADPAKHYAGLGCVPGVPPGREPEDYALVRILAPRSAGLHVWSGVLRDGG